MHKYQTTAGNMVRTTGLDMHFRFAKIKVRRHQADGGNAHSRCIWMGSNPVLSYGNKIREAFASLVLFGPDDRIRTCGILLPKQALYQTEPRPEI